MKLIKPKEAIALLIVLAVLLTLIFIQKNSAAASVIDTAAEITVTAAEGKQVYRVRLNENRRFSLESVTSAEAPDMEFEAVNGDIRVIKSDCPGEDCVHQGFASKNGGVIICVPNRVTVNLLDHYMENEYDASL
ncbi:MAG: NusG domain II-containing protein [Ruminococcus sp.]|jgi:hypothetical protein|nr:NusG domain II-containing protein [Ruminococcus sp.]